MNWKRRCFNRRKYRIAFTPIDSIIMALTEPGKFKVKPVLTHGTPVVDHVISHASFWSLYRPQTTDACYAC